MTPPSTPRPSTRPRRIKRGIVAGYIHDISPRHRATSSPIPTATPLRKLTLQPSPATAG